MIGERLCNSGTQSRGRKGPVLQHAVEGATGTCLRFGAVVALLALLAAGLPASAGGLLWSQNLDALLGADIVARTEPVVAKGKVFLATQKGWSAETGQWVVCLDAGDGKLVWKTKLPGWGAYNQGVAVAGGRVYVGWSLREGNKDTGWLYALAEETGKELWRCDLQESDGWCGAPRVKDGKVVFASSLGRAYALSEKDGKVLWRTPYLGGFSGGAPVIGDVDKDGDVEVVFSYTGGGTVVLNLADGIEEWRAMSAYWSVGPPVLAKVDNQRALIQLSEEIAEWRKVNLRSLDAMTGEILWDSGDITIAKGNITSPAAGQGRVLFGTCGCDDKTKEWTSRELYAYDIATGKLAWQRSLDSGVVTSPTVTASGQVVVRTATSLCCLSATEGGEVWREELAGSPSDPPGGIALSRDALFCVSLEGVVYAYRLDAKEGDDWPLRGGDMNAGSRMTGGR